jgi:hypothetical protein
MAQLVLTATQMCSLEVRITDRAGNPASVQNAAWTSSEPETITVEPGTGNPLIATVKAMGPVDEASMVKFEADADLGEGVEPIIATLDVIVTAGKAMVVEIVAGTPTEQP